MPKMQWLKWPQLLSKSTQNQTFNSVWLVVDAAFVDVNYKYFESEVWTKFGIWIFVKITKSISMSMRLKTLNILKLNDILNNILKLKFGWDYDADERACWYGLSTNPPPPSSRMKYQFGCIIGQTGSPPHLEQMGWGNWQIIGQAGVIGWLGW